MCGHVLLRFKRKDIFSLFLLDTNIILCTYGFTFMILCRRFLVSLFMYFFVCFFIFKTDPMALL